MRPVQIAGLAHLRGAEAQDLEQARREIDRVVLDIPVVEIFVNRLEGQRIALGIRRRRCSLRSWLARGRSPGCSLGSYRLASHGFADRRLGHVLGRNLGRGFGFVLHGLCFGFVGSTNHARNRHSTAPPTCHSGRPLYRRCFAKAPICIVCIVHPKKGPRTILTIRIQRYRDIPAIRAAPIRGPSKLRGLP